MAAAADNIYGQGNWDNPTGQRAVIPFRFATNNFANGIAARIYVVDEQATSTVLQSTHGITQAKRALAMNGTLTGPGLTVEQLEAYAKVGMAREILIHENMTVRSRLNSNNNRTLRESFTIENRERSVSIHQERCANSCVCQVSGKDANFLGSSMAMLPLTGFSGTGLPLNGNFGEAAAPNNATHDLSRDDGLPVRTQLVPRMIPFEASRPLIKRASPKDLAAARSIVKQALAESDKLNRARVANPRRNKYSLTPGKQISRRQLSSNETIQLSDSGTAPLLVITTEIADAAALVAEAEVGGHATNITRRAAAAGTFWMQRSVLPS